MEISIEELRKLCKDETIIITHHALERCRERGISFTDVKTAIMTGEVIENYPDAYPSPCCLLLSTGEILLHVVAGIRDGLLWIITAYVPTLDKWEPDYKTRKVEE